MREIGFGVQDQVMTVGVHDSGMGYRVWGSGFRVSDAGFGV